MIPKSIVGSLTGLALLVAALLTAPAYCPRNNQTPPPTALPNTSKRPNIILILSDDHALRTERYNLIRFYGPKAFWELYDLKIDPHEVHNLYGQRGYQTLTAHLKASLRAQIVHYQDEQALQPFDTSRRELH